MQYVYGPVTSRRLGCSLGVDLTPERCCSLDCIYCEEAKPTANLCTTRNEYAPTLQVIEQIREAVTPEVDYVTFSGSGEPTLHSGLGIILASCRDLAPPTAVLTNSSLLNMERVRQELNLADLVIPSLDAVSEEAFNKLNRPAPGVSAKRIMQGLESFCGEYTGTVWLEVLLVEGVNDNRQEVQLIAEFVNKLSVDKVHLNTVSRATTVADCRPVAREKMEQLVDLFSAPVEIYT